MLLSAVVHHQHLSSIVQLVSEGSFCLVLHRQLGKGVDVLSEFFFHEEVSEFLLFSKGVSWSGSLLLTPE